MGLFNSIRLGSSAAGDYEIKRSLRFNDGDSPNLARTFGSSTNVRLRTISVWVKRSKINDSGGQAFFQYGVSGAGDAMMFQGAGTGIGINDQFRVGNRNATSGSGDWELRTNRLFRDTSAWYHIVLQYDTTQSTESDRVKLYVNGVQETSFAAATYPSQNYDSTAFLAGTGGAHNIGYGIATGSANYFGGYLAEFNFLDGYAYDASYFGETNSDTGQWIPKKYIGSYGTNGFYLKFLDNSGTTATTLGKDSSGNSNNFTPNNFGTGDAVKDSPTNNFCTFLSIQKTAATTFSEGNLKGVNNAQHKTLYGNFGLRSGKWYWEAIAVSGSANKWTYGVSDIENTKNTQVSGTNYLLANSSATYDFGDAVSIYRDDLYKNGSNVSSSYQTIPSAGDIIGVALDVDAGKVWFSRNGTWINGSATASTTLDASNHDTTVATGKVYTPAYAEENVGWQANFGQDSSFSNATTAQGNTDANGKGDFYYAVPSGFKAICTANLPDPAIAKPNQHFDTLTWTGNGSSRNITGLEFDPDWVWIKNRDLAYDGEIYDTIRGSNNRLFSADTPHAENLTNLISGGQTGGLSFGQTGGFSLTGSASLNASSDEVVAWNWYGGGSTVTNDDGSIDSQVRANTTAGFSIVTYTGTGSDETVGHGLGVAPDLLIVKNRTDPDQWGVYFRILGTDGILQFSVVNTQWSGGFGTFNNQHPTSSVFEIDGASGMSGLNNENFVAYLFSEVAGYSKFGKYKGNGDSDGPFVYTGFKPAYVVTKGATFASNWNIFDNKRNPHNVTNKILFTNLNSVEATGSSSDNQVDFLSNGFKLRGSNVDTNSSGNTFTYIAFAESPFKYSRAK